MKEKFYGVYNQRGKAHTDHGRKNAELYTVTTEKEQYIFVKCVTEKRNGMMRKKADKERSAGTYCCGCHIVAS